jgi:2-octaprenyl-6-methoxyphenol hydroxylase
MLKHRGFHPRVVEARERMQPERDTRVLALSAGSREILERLGAHPAGATPIRKIHISQKGGFGRTQIHAHEHGLPALGYVLRAQQLIEHLLACCEQAGVTIDYGVRIESTVLDGECVRAHCAGGGSLDASCLIHAEGSVGEDDNLREHDYQQDALLCSATPLTGHQYVAFERFTPQGPFALLPLGDAYSVVATAQRSQSEALLALPDDAFLALLNEAFGSRVRLTALGPRSRYPLRLRYRKEIAQPRQVWLGNAAQTLHPVAGQGFNLALRDAASLARSMDANADPGAPTRLAAWQRSRRFDRWGTMGFTDTLIRVFSNHDPLMNTARGLGLLALELAPPVRNFVARRMMLGARGWL